MAHFLYFLLTILKEQYLSRFNLNFDFNTPDFMVGAGGGGGNRRKKVAKKKDKKKNKKKRDKK